MFDIQRENGGKAAEETGCLTFCMYIRQTKVPTQFFATRPNFLYVFTHIMKVIFDQIYFWYIRWLGSYVGLKVPYSLPENGPCRSPCWPRAAKILANQLFSRFFWKKSGLSFLIFSNFYLIKWNHKIAYTKMWFHFIK